MSLKVIRNGEYKVSKAELTFSLIWTIGLGVVFGWFYGYALGAAVMLVLAFTLGWAWKTKLDNMVLADEVAKQNIEKVEKEK